MLPQRLHDAAHLANVAVLKGVAGRRFAARISPWLLPADKCLAPVRVGRRRALQCAGMPRGILLVAQGQAAITPSSGCLRQPSDMHVGLQGCLVSEKLGG
ncbi:hypothetical protein V8C37DRAFT_369741 [Trichoderma ceciliae]